MQEALLQPSQRPVVPFNDFLAALLQALEREGLRPCILRNYEGFPANNLGNDVDFLILPSELPRAMRALRSIQNIRLVNYTELSFIASVFLEGTSTTPGSRSLQVDFFWSLCSKGPPFLATETVLQASNPRRAGDLNFYVPSPVHEAIISLFASLLLGGWLKEKYFPQGQRTFASDRSEVLAALLPQFGLKAATRLVDAVIACDCPRVLNCIKPLRFSLTLRCLLHEPIRGALAIARYYARTFTFRFSPKNIETVCILGQGNCDKTAIIEGLIPMLHSAVKVAEKNHFRPWSSFAREPSGIDASADSRAAAQSGSLASMAKAVLWLLEEWKSQFLGKKNLTLRIAEHSYHDLLIDPEKYGYGGPRWFARLVGKLLPSPDLWILLDPAAEESQSRTEKTPPAETLRQLEYYRAFVKTRKSYAILDASQTADRVKESAYAAIIDALARRTSGNLKH